MKHLIIVGVCLLTFFSQAQDVKIYWKENPVLVGTHAELKISIQNVPTDFSYKPNSGSLIGASKHTQESLWKPGAELEIAHFQDTLKKNRYECTYTLIAWDSADYRMDPLPFQLGDTIIQVEVPTLHVTFTKHPVKDGIIEITVQPEEAWWIFFKKYGWIFFLGILVIFGFIWWNKRKRVVKEPYMSLRERTLKALEQIRMREDWKTDMKVHYSAFSSVLKMYLSSLYSLNFTERTTQETIQLLKIKRIHPDTIKRIERLLFDSDMVKFAKINPTEDQVLDGLRHFEELIHELSPLEMPHE